MNTKPKRASIRAAYLDYVNNFLSVERFAAFYDISPNVARRVIKWGRSGLFKTRTT